MGERIVGSPVLLSAIAAGVAFVLLVWLNRGIWFFGDDFGFIVQRRALADDGQWAKAILMPHNEHPAVLPAIVYLVLQETTGMRHPILYALPMILMHAVVVFCTGLILSRHLRSRSWMIAGLVAVVFLAAGWENMLWTFQFGFIGAVAFGVIHLIAVTAEAPSRRTIAVAVVAGANAALMAGHGIVFVVVGGIALTRRRRWRLAAMTAGIPVVVFALWYLAYGRTEKHAGSTWSERLLLPRYLWRGLTESADGVLLLPGSAFVVLVAAVAVMIVRSDLVTRLTLPVLLALSTVLFYGLTGFGRVRYGIDQATASRYAYVGVVLLVPIVFLALEHFVGDSRHRHVTALILAGWIAVAGVTELRDIAADRRDLDAKRLAVMSAAGELVLAGRVADPDLAPSPQWDRNIAAADVAGFIERGWWPDGHVDRRSLLRAATIVGLNLSSDGPIATDDGLHPVTVANARTTEADPGCIRVEPYSGATATVSPVSAGPIGLRVADDTTVSIALRYPGSSRVEPRDFEVDAGPLHRITGWLDDSEVVLLLPPVTTYMMCGVTPES
jgi:hypothetical protein